MIDMEIKPYERMVYYYETDRMGIVHHSNYIRWFEEARLDWMKQVGWDYKTIEDDNIIIPVLSVSAEYKTMSRYGDNVVIYVKLAEYTGVRIGFSYEVHDKKTGELGASAHPAIVCWMRRTSRCSCGNVIRRRMRSSRNS